MFPDCPPREDGMRYHELSSHHTQQDDILPLVAALTEFQQDKPTASRPFHGKATGICLENVLKKVPISISRDNRF